MNKKVKIALISLFCVLIIVGLSLTIKRLNSPKEPLEEGFQNKPNELVDEKEVEKEIISEEKIIDEETEGIHDENGKNIFDPNDTHQAVLISDIPLTSIESVTDNYVKGYLQLLLPVFSGQSYEEFPKEKISEFVAVLLLVDYSASSDKIKTVVKQYFDIDDFILNIGPYETRLFGNFDIDKVGDIYYSNLMPAGFSCPCHIFNSLEFNGNEVIANYSYVEGEIDDARKIGETKVYMVYNEGYLQLTKIIHNDI